VVGDRPSSPTRDPLPPGRRVRHPDPGLPGHPGGDLFDTGGAYFHRFQRFQYYDSDTKRLKDGRRRLRLGITTQLLGLDVNWDFARQWDLKQQLSGYRTDFLIGTRF